MIKRKPLPKNQSKMYVSDEDAVSENLITTTTNERKENGMQTKEEHQDTMEKKSKDSLKKYDLYMLGTGMFSDHPFATDKKNKKEKKVET